MVVAVEKRASSGGGGGGGGGGGTGRKAISNRSDMDVRTFMSEKGWMFFSLRESHWGPAALHR